MASVAPGGLFGDGPSGIESSAKSRTGSTEKRRKEGGEEYRGGAAFEEEYRGGGAFEEGYRGGGAFDCVHMRRRDFAVDHAAEEVGVEEYARLAMAKLGKLRQGERLQKSESPVQVRFVFSCILYILQLTPHKLSTELKSHDSESRVQVRFVYCNPSYHTTQTTSCGAAKDYKSQNRVFRFVSIFVNWPLHDIAIANSVSYGVRAVGDGEVGEGAARRKIIACSGSYFCFLLLAFTRYCHCQYCMVYGIQKGGRGGVVYLSTRGWRWRSWCSCGAATDGTSQNRGLIRNSHHNSRARSRETVPAPKRCQCPEDQKRHRGRISFC